MPSLGHGKCHDKISRVLYNETTDDKSLARKAHSKGKRKQREKTIIIDDSVQYKPYSKVIGLVAYHYDHTEGRSVKGINFINALWADEENSVSLSLQMWKKNCFGMRKTKRSLEGY